MTGILLKIIKMIRKIMGFLLPASIFAEDIFSNFYNYLDFFVDILIQANFLIPLPTIFHCLEIIIGIKVIKFSIFLTNWLLQAIFDIIP